MKHQYLEDADSIIVNDSVDFNHNMKRLAAELLKAHPVALILEDLMRQTYPNRRASILSGESSLMDTCEKFPLLKNAKHVCIVHIYTDDDLRVYYVNKLDMNSKGLQGLIIQCSNSLMTGCKYGLMLFLLLQNAKL